MLTILGNLALSSYRLSQLLAQLKAIDANIHAVTARFIHFVSSNKVLNVLERHRLDCLLNYGCIESKTNYQGKIFLVLPRLGTQTSWSSKASEIAKNCGLDVVKRIERGIEYRVVSSHNLNTNTYDKISHLLHDRMTQMVVNKTDNPDLFAIHPPQPLQTIAILEQGRDAIVKANIKLGLTLSSDEIDYLYDCFQNLAKNPSDAELMMFAQINSEHCRHKIFNASWNIDGIDQEQSLFSMIRNTTDKNPHGVLSAYSDNSAVIEGYCTKVLLCDQNSREYKYVTEKAHLLMKVETHNHPTAISPYPGAATGSGGEIRDEAATGRGSASKAGLSGFTVSHLKIPNFRQPWEHDFGKPAGVASALEIMLAGPVGSAAFNNEFGRPNITGYFRSFEQILTTKTNQSKGYHKPIMLAGGMGNIRPMLVEKHKILSGSPIIILGGPTLLIGLGGGSASSKITSTSTTELDFASVQRENPEMQRRCQEVINRCNAMGNDTPIISIHDIGAGGLANAVPEIIQDCKRGGRFELRYINNADQNMSPMQIWCNEAQERYVLSIKPESLALFKSFCEREHCLYAVIGVATKEQNLTLNDKLLGGQVIDMPMSILFEKPPKIHKKATHIKQNLTAFSTQDIKLSTAIKRVLAFPAVADKSFLITIGDRSVTGLVARDQMVGPWQIPVADVAVTASGFKTLTGEAMAVGERTPLAVINPPASGRIAVAEALTNLAAAYIGPLNQVKLSANWMASSASSGENAALFDTVKAVGMELCPKLGLAIPVGKDSLSMKTSWNDKGQEKTVTSPVSLIITAFAPVLDISKTLTPQLKVQDSIIILIDLGLGKNRLGGSVLAQVYNQLGDTTPDLEHIILFKNFFKVIQTLNNQAKILAYHDRSDGGLLVTLAEMMFAGRVGMEIDLSSLSLKKNTILAGLFNEELGAVIQIKKSDLSEVCKQFKNAGLESALHLLGNTTKQQQINFLYQGKKIYQSSRTQLQQIWSSVSYKMQSLRDNPKCARQQFKRIADDNDPGLSAFLTFTQSKNKLPQTKLNTRPKVAILREQGVNGHAEMAAAFDYAGFNAIDVHMRDILHTRVSLQEFIGLIACGGFSYGDVLGAGYGWAKSILFNPKVRKEFAEFFQRQDTFALGVCNGCQMMSALKEIIPGADYWPKFKRNNSEQFEARVSMVKVQPSPAILLQGMEGSLIPISTAHGEGLVEFTKNTDHKHANIALSYVDNYANLTTDFPANPNGSAYGITGLTNTDGRFTIMMPHPERCFRTIQNSWYPQNWGKDGAWMKLFRNARDWVG